MLSSFSQVRGWRRAGLACWPLLWAAGCFSTGDAPSSLAPSHEGAVTSAGVTAANLQLQVSKNACAPNLAQNYFKVTNGTGAAVPLSQLAIKFWVDDTSAANIVASVFYGGCVTNASGTCLHPVTGVTSTATRFSPACGPDATHQANWEITITTTDSTPLAAGQIWSGVQSGIKLANQASFSPGAANWFSGCGSGQPYAADPRFALYDNGDLVQASGTSVPLCRAPDQVQIQAFIDASYYAGSDVRSSFLSQGRQIDCIDFAAQRAVKAWAAAGVTIPTSAPPPPAGPAGMPAPNFPSAFAFNGQPDANGHAQACAAGQVPVSRPTVADIQAAGGVAAFVQAHAARTRLMRSGMQDPAEHDCWLNNAPGDGEPIGTANAVDWEHAAGVQTSGFQPATANGFFGAHAIASIYAPLMDAKAPVSQGLEHTDSQFWVQTGNCEDWYPSPAETQSHQNQCQTGAACTNCTGASCASCAVQSLELASLVDTGKAPRLALFFTTDGYFQHNCFAGDPSCLGCPTTTTSVSAPGAGTLTQATDCFVAWPGAKFTPNQALPVNTAGPGGSQYGVAPNEIELAVWNGAAAGKPGWWVFVNGNLIGWYPPQTFNWSDGSAGPLSNGPATYLQAGGEVFDVWPGGAHTDTSMVSDNAADAGFQFAAYQRNLGYLDSTDTFHDANLTYAVAPATEGDNGIPGVCGLHSGGWTDQAGQAGAYTLSTTTPAGGTNWGQYVYFGGGLLKNEKRPVLSPVTITYSQYAACTGFATSSGITSTGPNAAYVVFQLTGIDNSGNSVPFNFDQSKLFVADPHDGANDFVDPNLMIYPNIFGGFAAVNGTVPAGAKESFQTPQDVALVVTTATSDGSVEANQTGYVLQYKSGPSDPPVTLTKSNAGQTSFPAGQPDCQQIGLTAP